MSDRIKRLIEARTRTLADSRRRISEFASSKQFTSEYKRDQIADWQKDLAQKEAALTAEINTAIAEERKELVKRYYAKPPLDLAGEIRALREHFETNELAEELIRDYPKSNEPTGLREAEHREAFVRETFEAIELGLPNAAAMVKAAKAVLAGTDTLTEIIGKYAESRVTPQQRETVGQIATLDQLNDQFTTERQNEAFVDRWGDKAAGLNE